jgi:predicted SAM-dependent methyltransferase
MGDDMSIVEQRQQATNSGPETEIHSNSEPGIYVQYGCGPVSAPPQWTNFDASLTLRFERIPLIGRLYTKNAQRFPENAKWGDIVKGLPIADQSCQGIYASHVLEHLPLDHFHKALDNTKRLLRPGGIFRLIVPDLAVSAKEYVERLQSGDPSAADFFMRETHLGRPTTKPGLAGLFFKAMATSFHYWMWDYPSMMKSLREHGFQQVRECKFGDCEDPMFRFVEDEGRFENAVAVEARA